MTGTASDVETAGKTLTDRPAISIPGEVMGTYPYMAPEQIRGEQVDGRTDLFALGVVLHELATGSRPFSGGTAADVTSAILRDPPVSVRSAKPDLPVMFERIRWLERSYEFHDSGLILVKMSWMFVPLRSDPRWLPFLEKLGMAGTSPS